MRNSNMEDFAIFFIQYRMKKAVNPTPEEIELMK